MKTIIRCIVLMFLIQTTLGAQQIVSDELLREGVSSMRAGDYEDAASRFKMTLLDPNLEPFHSDALYWLTKADIALHRYEEAASAAYRYSVMYPGEPYHIEMEYQRARLLYLEGERENAIIALGDFIEEYPDSDFVPSAYYWTGEALMDLGRLEEADAVFSQLLSEFPSSVKREAARYRRSEISLLYRERELLNLLKWSHEEYLHDAEGFYRREAEFMAALDSYGSRVGDETDSALRLARNETLLEAKARLLTYQRYYVEQLLGLSDDR